MRILAVVPLVPWPLDRGDRMRAWELLTELAHHGDLTLALTTREPLSSQARRALTGLSPSIHVYDVGSGVWNAVVGMLQGLPPALGAYWNPRIASQLRIQDDPWDLVVAFQLRAAPYALTVNATVRAIDFTDSLAMFRKRLPWFGRSGLQRLLLTGVERVEARTPRQFDICWASAEDDARVISDLSGRSTMVVPNGCVPSPTIAPYESKGPLLFMGDMRYVANEDGIVHFVSAIWPAVYAQVPGCRLRIVGRPTRRVVKMVARPGIELVGPIPDVMDELTHAAAVINPVRYGSGSSRKVLTGWAAGRPVVSTRAGLRGLSYNEGTDILIADTPQQWVRTVTWIRMNPRSAADIGRAGWKRVRRAHDAGQAWAVALAASEITKSEGAMRPVGHQG
jgi:glycosyltransferase involved in cell wall biosynthesis